MDSYAPKGYVANSYAQTPYTQQTGYNQNGYTQADFVQQGLSEDDFGSSKGGLKSFDAFPKTKATYLTSSKSGGVWTVTLMILCSWLIGTEFMRWFSGTITHTFSVEKGVSHDLQINFDVTVAMKCDDVRVNVQDAAGDHILAGQKLQKDPTNWFQWSRRTKAHKLGAGQDKQGLDDTEDVHDYLSGARGKKKFSKTPKLRGVEDACRIFGSLDGNKVQGDFHITARGHGYMEFGEHLSHDAFNFSHEVNEMSFGQFYPSLENPLDNTYETTPNHFFKFQYYLSVVPTVYTTDPEFLARVRANRKYGMRTPTWSPSTIWTNQYAVTEQSHIIGESQVPGVFFKFDIEPIVLTIAEQSGSFLAFLVRVVNVISGVMVGGEWCYRLSEWAVEVWGKRKRARSGSLGVLTGRESGEYYREKRYD